MTSELKRKRDLIIRSGSGATNTETLLLMDNLLELYEGFDKLTKEWTEKCVGSVEKQFIINSFLKDIKSLRETIVIL